VVPGEIPETVRNGEGQNRTGDTTIFSRVLYQLSYLAGAQRLAATGPPTPVSDACQAVAVAPDAALTWPQISIIRLNVSGCSSGSTTAGARSLGAM
jgi:hypothetical protein